MGSSYESFQANFASLDSITFSSRPKLRSRRILTRFIHGLWSRHLSTSREYAHSLELRLTRSSPTLGHVQLGGTISLLAHTTQCSHRNRAEGQFNSCRHGRQ